jgi:hypothetical protein
MKAIIFRQHGSLDMLEYVEHMPVPELGPNDALVRVQYAALNRLDQFVVKGWKGLDLELPHIPGADFSGALVAMGQQVRGWTAGQPVTANPSLWCGQCSYCLRGEQGLCDRFAILGEHTRGSFAQYIKVPARNPPGRARWLLHAAGRGRAHRGRHHLAHAGHQRPGAARRDGAGDRARAAGSTAFTIALAKLLGATVWVVAGDAGPRRSRRWRRARIG